MNQPFSFKHTEIDDVLLINPFISSDDRGGFIKDYSRQIFLENGIDYYLMEVFYTISKKGVIRAIHFQRENQQPKLVRCIHGKIFDVVVDLRKRSSTFGKWISFELSDKNNYEILVPKGCGHGYLVLDEAIVSYKCAEKFYKEYDDGIIWNDTDLNINWPINEVNEIILSEKDKQLQTFSNFKKKYSGF